MLTPLNLRKPHSVILYNKIGTPSTSPNILDNKHLKKKQTQLSSHPTQTTKASPKSQCASTSSKKQHGSRETNTVNRKSRSASTSPRTKNNAPRELHSKQTQMTNQTTGKKKPPNA
ncbi:hypothetical protein KC19_11G015400 [Ceratodon purpureus]|uniref:Uncharacterized protein n=1 Tax=Ceratodon purpureus TaxID=3225 RepID=A0A8T0GC80_CERPU|nr:hypothetical protein KC19_11G015400 [Ceratodon purpureus]